MARKLVVIKKIFFETQFTLCKDCRTPSRVRHRAISGKVFQGKQQKTGNKKTPPEGEVRRAARLIAFSRHQ